MVTSEPRSTEDTRTISSTALSKGSRFAADGVWKPLIFRTNCNAAERTSSSVAGGSKLYSVLMFLHMAPEKIRDHGPQRRRPGSSRYPLRRRCFV